MSAMKKPTIVIQYPFIALYRIPVFSKLSSSEKFTYTFWSGKASPDRYLKSSFNSSDINIVELPLKVLKIPFTNKAFEFQFSSIKQLIDSRPDVYIILGNPNSLTTWFSIITARALGCTALSWSHGFLFNEKGIKGFIRKLFYKLSHGHLLYGNNAKNIMLKKGFSNEELDVIYNSLDYSTQSKLREINTLEERNNIRDKYDFDRNGIVLISIGRLMSKLKIEQVIEALSIANKCQNTYLIIVGDGPDKDNLMRLALELELKDKVIFYGECHDEKELSLLYNASDISIVMGKVGLSAMHSLAYGVPMITNNSMYKHFPEIEAIIENKTGWYFKEDDIEDFVSKLHKIEYKGDIYHNCIQTIEDHYTPDKQVYFIEQAIKKHLHL